MEYGISRFQRKRIRSKTPRNRPRKLSDAKRELTPPLIKGKMIKGCKEALLLGCEKIKGRRMKMQKIVTSKGLVEQDGIENQVYLKGITDPGPPICYKCGNLSNLGEINRRLVDEILELKRKELEVRAEELELELEELKSHLK